MSIRVDAAKSQGELKPIWRFFGADELNYAYHDDDVPGPDAAITLTLAGLPFDDGEARLKHCRIDDDHSIAFGAWRRMGSPLNPSPEQYSALVQEGQLAALGPPETVRFTNGAVSLTFTLPRQGVSMLLLEWGASPKEDLEN